MDRHILNHKGFSLIELAIVMGVITILGSAITPMVVRTIELKAVDKTAAEIIYIQEAARNYYTAQHKWPNAFEDLIAGNYLNSRWSFNNPWNNPYIIDPPLGNSFSISTDIPQYLTQALFSHLPLASVDKKTVTSVITSPLPNDSIAKGVIVAWWGSTNDVPVGWLLCDGNNGTPNLKDRFIVGAIQDDEATGKPASTIQGFPAVSGAPEGHTGEHVLTIAEMPSHHHNSFDCSSPHGGCYADFGGEGAWKGFTGGGTGQGLVAYQTSDAGGDQPHSHTIPNSQIIPSYYALAFIMKQ